MGATTLTGLVLYIRPALMVSNFLRNSLTTGFCSLTSYVVYLNNFSVLIYSITDLNLSQSGLLCDHLDGQKLPRKI